MKKSLLVSILMLSVSAGSVWAEGGGATGSSGTRGGGEDLWLHHSNEAPDDDFFKSGKEDYLRFINEDLREALLQYVKSFRSLNQNELKRLSKSVSEQMYFRGGDNVFEIANRLEWILKNPDLETDIMRSNYVSQSSCVDSEGHEKTASTLNGVLRADICINIELAKAHKMSKADLIGLFMHEHSRHLYTDGVLVWFDSFTRMPSLVSMDEDHHLGRFVERTVPYFERRRQSEAEIEMAVSQLSIIR